MRRVVKDFSMVEETSKSRADTWISLVFHMNLAVDGIAVVGTFSEISFTFELRPFYDGTCKSSLYTRTVLTARIVACTRAARSSNVPPSYPPNFLISSA